MSDIKSTFSHIKDWDRLQKLFAIIAVVILLALLLISLGNSQTSPLSSSGGISHESDPDSYYNPAGNDNPSNLPWNPDIGNVDPSHLPPLNPGNFPSGGFPSGGLPTGNNPTFNPPNIPTVSPPNGNFPNIPSNTISPPDVKPPEFNPGDGFGGIDDGSPQINVTPPSFNINQDRPKFRHFPSVNLSKLGDLSIGGISFKVLIPFSTLLLVFVVMLPLVITTTIPHILAIGKEKSEIEDYNFMQDMEKKKKEVQAKLRRERRKRLNSFHDYVKEILLNLPSMKETMKIDEIVVQIYHDLDLAFSQFSNLKREPGITPLEHSHSIFTDAEIHTDHLEEIVNLFYRTRFGHKMITESDVETLTFLLKNLVRGDALSE